MTATSRRVGMLDSGLGGLTVLSALRSLTSAIDITYFADTAHVPYGDRSLRDVARLGKKIVERLMEKQPALLIVASGTTCAAFDAGGWPEAGAPLIGVVDQGARAACAASRTGKIGVIATNATIASGVFERAIHALRHDAVVTNVGAPALVPIVESGGWASVRARDAVATSCGAFTRAGCDAVILGCTHFPHLAAWFAAALGPRVHLVDPAAACAQDASRLLSKLDPAPNRNAFEVSGDAEAFAAHATLLSGVRVDALEHVDL